MLNIQDVDVNIGTIKILRRISLKVPPGKMAGLIGRNGAGKTTLLRTTMGLLPMGSGKILIDGGDITEKPAHMHARLGVGYMPEDRRLVPNLSVKQNILLPAWASGEPISQSRLEWIYKIMPEVMERENQKANQLSGGQQKMVALARAMMIGKEILLLDEPFEGLAPAMARRLGEVISSLKERGLSVLIADSNEQHIVDFIDLRYRIERGVVEQVQ